MSTQLDLLGIDASVLFWDEFIPKPNIFWVVADTEKPTQPVLFLVHSVAKVCNASNQTIEVIPYLNETWAQISATVDTLEQALATAVDSILFLGIFF